MNSSDWSKFWKNQKQSFNAAMKISTDFFALQLEKVFQLKPTDEILDYGCGPGFLADFLITKNISVTGADINQFFIEQCKKKHDTSLFIQITTDTAANKRILKERLDGKTFDFIILLSISQYFKDIEELENVVGMLHVYIREKGKILIADVIDLNTSSYRDAASLLSHCVREGKTMVFIRFMFYLVFSNYRELSRRLKLLRISEQAICQIADRNFLNYEKINGLTIHPSRTSYVLTNKRDFG